LGASAGSSERPGGRPRFTVLITAHGRREFLLEALRSARSAGAPTDGLEILVVKDFTDPEIDAEIDRAGAQRIETDEVPLGAKVARGIAASHGELIAFLEDDDAFVPGRLEHVDALFGADPALGFYRNGQLRIGPDEHPIPAGEYGRAHDELVALGTVAVSPGELHRRLDALVRIDPDFNLSSIVVPREILADRVEELRPLAAAVDSFVFYAALEARRALRIESNPLTRYRVHPANVSTLRDGQRESEVRRWTEYQERFLRAFGPIFGGAIARGPAPAARLAGSAYYGTWIVHRLLTGRGGRGGMLHDLIAFWRWSPLPPLRFRRDLTFWAIAALLAPSAARRAFLARRGSGTHGPPGARPAAEPGRAA
jgi:glycosyltransferase involved in cell wall biosynthesis